ncbi:Aldo-ket-red domain-containing protein [Mycena kentingensis (nom. inval.)]|nr:Aldo-ket-red domain-containing protein [Mycena kentingensis (nom. inval.)]
MSPTTTTFIIETTAGSPVFHIPAPISNLSTTENVCFHFKNLGGTPIFYVGRAEVGVTAADAVDYVGVVRRVAEQRQQRAAGQLPQGVRIKMEQASPFVPISRKGKERERAVPQPTLVFQQELAPRTPTPQRHPSPRPAQRQPLTKEEHHAFARGSLTWETYANFRAQVREEFAGQLNPMLPVTRKLGEEEEDVAAELWDDILRLDRVFSGPLRDVAALEVRYHKIIQAAAERFPHINIVNSQESNPGRSALQPVQHPFTPARSQVEQVVNEWLKTSGGMRPPRTAKENSLEEIGSIPNTKQRKQPEDVLENASPRRPSGSGHKRRRAAEPEASERADGLEETARPNIKRVRIHQVEAPAETRVPSLSPSTVTRDGHTYKKKSTLTPLGREYDALIPQPPLNSESELPVLSAAEVKWLEAQSDLARPGPPAAVRPVLWLTLGERMMLHSYSNAGIRPLHHGVLLAAWDRGEWRWKGHEKLGRRGVPWGEWVLSEDGRRWMAGESS